MSAPAPMDLTMLDLPEFKRILAEMLESAITKAIEKWVIKDAIITEEEKELEITAQGMKDLEDESLITEFVGSCGEHSEESLGMNAAGTHTSHSENMLKAQMPDKGDIYWLNQWTASQGKNSKNMEIQGNTRKYGNKKFQTMGQDNISLENLSPGFFKRRKDFKKRKLFE